MSQNFFKMVYTSLDFSHQSTKGPGTLFNEANYVQVLLNVNGKEQII